MSEKEIEKINESLNKIDTAITDIKSEIKSAKTEVQNEIVNEIKKKFKISNLVIILGIILIGLSVGYYFGIKQFVHEKLIVKEDTTITVNCDCKCADGCKCTENNDCKCTDCCKCGDEKYIIVTNSTAPNITAIVCITAAFIAVLICLTVITVKLIGCCKKGKNNSDEVPDIVIRAYKNIFDGKDNEQKQSEKANTEQGSNT